MMWAEDDELRRRDTAVGGFLTIVLLGGGMLIGVLDLLNLLPV